MRVHVGATFLCSRDPTWKDYPISLIFIDLGEVEINYQPENVWWQLRGWNQGSLICQVVMTMILVAVTAG
jgi:hypothetical protein